MAYHHLQMNSTGRNSLIIVYLLDHSIYSIHYSRLHLDAFEVKLVYIAKQVILASDTQ